MLQNVALTLQNNIYCTFCNIYLFSDSRAQTCKAVYAFYR